MSTRSSKLSSSAGSVLAYLKDESRTLQEYYDGFNEVWGKGAQTLGIERGITREQFERLFNGQNPHTGDQLTRVRHKKVVGEDGVESKVVDRNAMVDIVFGTPKSMSELLVASSAEMREQIIAATKRAAHQAFMKAIEREGKVARIPARLGAKRLRADGRLTDCTSQYVPADLIAVPVVQFTARDTETTLERGVADPHLHVHVPVFTMCQGPNGRWYTADEYGWKNEFNAKLRDQIFLGELARELEQLGIEIEYKDFDRARKGEVGWEVRGSNEEVRKHWSTNTERAWALRKAWEDEHESPMPEELLKEKLYKTRIAKSEATKQQDSDPVWELWERDLEKAGLRLGIPSPGEPVERDTNQAWETLQERLRDSNGFCRDGAEFDEKMLKGSIRRAAVGLGLDQEVLDGITRMYLNGDHDDIFVTRDAVEPEHRLFSTYALLDIEREIAEHRERMADRWLDITGPGGTGKSTVAGVGIHVLRTLDGAPITEPIDELVDRSCQQLEITLNDEQKRAAAEMVRIGEGCTHFVVASTAGATAERTGTKVKADAWGSVESLTARIDRGKLRVSPDTLLLVEEVGMVDTFRAGSLFKAVKDAPVVTMGDHKQLPAIGTSGWHVDALERHPAGTVELIEVRRFVNAQDARTYDLIRTGNAPKALADLNERGRVHEAATDSRRMADMFDKYRALRDSGQPARAVKMYFETNLEGDTANRFVQRDRLRRGEVGQQALVVELDERRWELREGDRIITLDPIYTRGQAPLANGIQGELRRIYPDGTGRVQLDKGGEVYIPLDGRVGLNYANTIHKGQGAEVEHALIGPGRATNANSGYTMNSRGAVESHTYISHESNGTIEDLGKAWQTGVEKTSLSRTLAERQRGQVAHELPPARSDELVHDVAMPPIDPNVDMSERFLDQRLLQDLPEQKLIEPSLDQSLDSDLGIGREL